ncbi:MAG: hypothetical protein WBQ34_00820 [Candidatus Acidiferrales bacterium]
MGLPFSDAVRRRFGTGFWALADQGAVSLGNFMTQIILARNLSHTKYGVFALIFGVLLFLFTCQSGLIAYPLSLEGASVGRAELRKVAFAAALLTFLLAFPLSLLVLGATIILHVAAITWAVVLAMLLWQLQETFRRALMSHLLHRAAIWGDVLSYGGQAVFVWLLARYGALSLQRVFVVVALTSALAALLQSLQVGWSATPLRAVLATARKYWSLGKWALLTGMTESGVRQAFPWMLALLYSPAEAASFQAVMNLVGVSHPIIFGTNNLVIPAAADAKNQRGTAAAFRTSSWYGALAGLLVLPFFTALFMWPHLALTLFYGSLSPYAILGTGLRLASVAYMLVALTAVLLAFLYGVGRSRFAFEASIGGTLVAIIPASFLMVYYGIVGAVAGILLVAFGKLVFGGALVVRTLRLDANVPSGRRSSSAGNSNNPLGKSGAAASPAIRVEGGRIGDA